MSDIEKLLQQPGYEWLSDKAKDDIRAENPDFTFRPGGILYLPVSAAKEMYPSEIPDK